MRKQPATPSLDGAPSAWGGLALPPCLPLLEALPQGALLTSGGRILEANPAATRILGLTREALLAETLDGLLASGGQERQDAAPPSPGLRRGVLSWHRHPTGQAWLAWSTVPLGEGLLVTFEDITASRTQALRLERMTQLYAALSQVNQAIVWFPTQAALLDRICEVMVVHGRFSLAWIALRRPGSPEVDVASRFGAPADYLDDLAFTTDYTPLGCGPVGIAIREGHPCVVNDFLGQAKLAPWHDKARRAGFRSMAAFPIRKEGGIQGALVVYASVLAYFGPHERVLLEEAAADLSFALEHIDLDARRLEAERALRESEERSRQAQKVESLGALAGGIAHDFNNLLTAILGNLNLAQSQLPEGGAARAHLGKAEATVLKAAELSRQMLAYSGKGHFVVRPCGLNGLIEEMTGLLAASLPKKVRLAFSLGAELPAFKADGAQIQQVVMNLVTNAAEAIGRAEGLITVSTFKADLDAAILTEGFPGQAMAAGAYLVLSVADTGCGMEPSVQSRIFDPFFSTKASGRGLGLSAMLGILKGHNAGIRIHSEPGRGSTFELIFPALGQVDARQDPPGPRTRARFQGKVLLVDDEAMILESTAITLEGMGFEVATACDGVEALERFEELAGELVLVFMDLSMPRMDGTTAFLAMRERRPEVPVVLTSGYDRKQATDGLLAMGLAGFVQKPYRMKDLAGELGRALERVRMG